MLWQQEQEQKQASFFLLNFLGRLRTDLFTHPDSVSYVGVAYHADIKTHQADHHHHRAAAALTQECRLPGNRKWRF